MTKKKPVVKVVEDAEAHSNGASVAEVVQDDEVQVNGVGALSILSSAIAGELAAAAMQMYLEAKGITGNFRVVVTAAKLVRISPPSQPVTEPPSVAGAAPVAAGEPGAGGRAAKERLQGNGAVPSSR